MSQSEHTRTPSTPIRIVIPDQEQDYTPMHPNGSHQSSYLSPFSHSMSTLSKRNEPFGTLVGSYEESILTGRMSQLPSKPIPFTAEIGVTAQGKSQQKLKCPKHLSVPFDGYFYDLEDEKECRGTPYVGTVVVGGIDDGYRIPAKGTLQIVSL